MEIRKLKENVTNNIAKNHSFSISDNKITATGVVKIESYTKTKIMLKLSEKVLIIDGNNFELGKLDKDSGQITAFGEVTSLRYQQSFMKSKFMDRLTR